MNLNDENIIEITDELSCEYEISKVLRQYPKDTVVIRNVKGFDIPVVSGICNTRDKIAESTAFRIASQTCASHIPHIIPSILSVVLIISLFVLRQSLVPAPCTLRSHHHPERRCR